uniref:BglII/BstYI family type II restriction endonuclease n=1 Tax=uncultured Bilophila sp. TaxID=529385 RepID=UPI0025F742B7|nr:BglII/BstYI family type II restriction endonuclease [uncultured Bilophila sp.]
MKIVAEFDFNGGKSAVETKYSKEFSEIVNVVNAVDALSCKNKESHEVTMDGRILFSPKELNKKFKEEFKKYCWSNYSVECEYIYGNYLDGYIPSSSKKAKPFRDMDFLKKGVKLGVEVQFGKYAFMVYNVCAKMTIFSNLGKIDTGIEIVPVKHLADEMSTGVSYFEQFAWDLTKRGTSNIDIPVLILGIDV